MWLLCPAVEAVTTDADDTFDGPFGTAEPFGLGLASVRKRANHLQLGQLGQFETPFWGRPEGMAPA